MANPTVEALEKKLVEGLKFKIESSELAKLMHERASYHEGRAATKREELPKLKESLEAIGKAPSATSVSSKFSNSSANVADMVDQIEGDIKTHENKCQSLKFLAAHVVPNVAYILTENDLRSLEVVK